MPNIDTSTESNPLIAKGNLSPIAPGYYAYSTTDSLATIQGQGYFDVFKIGSDFVAEVQCADGPYTVQLVGGVAHLVATQAKIESVSAMVLSGNSNPLDNYSTRDQDPTIATVTPDSPNAAFTVNYGTWNDRDKFTGIGSIEEVNRYFALTFAQVTEKSSVGNLSTGQSQVAGRWSFMFDGDEIDLQFASDKNFLIVVDGVFITKTTINSAGVFPANPRCNINFGSRKPSGRRIDVYGASSTTALYGVFFRPTDTVWTPTDNPKKVAMQGDSFSTGANSDVPGLYWPLIVANAFGWHNVLPNGFGGTGLLNSAGGTKYTFIERISDLVAFGPEKVIMALSGNDNSYGYEAVKAAMTEYIETLLSQLPAVELIVLGAPSRFTAEIETTELAGKAAIDEYNAEHGDKIKFIPFQTKRAGGLISGAGNVGAPQGDGNADNYISPDNTHYHVNGQVFYANTCIEGMLDAGVTY